METQDRQEEILFAQIRERSKTDPLTGAKIGAKEITQRCLAAFKNERGVHVETLLCALGSLAGYACQMAVVAKAKARGAPSPLTVVQTKDGKSYFFGDALNKPLAESKYSVWGIAAAGAQEAGCVELPDIEEMFKHAATVLGSDQFGRPRLPQGHEVGDLPINFAQKLWPQFQPRIAKFCPNPDHWPILLALSIQESIKLGKDALSPALALSIAMESAIATSKMNLSSAATSTTPQVSSIRAATPAQPSSAKPNNAASAHDKQLSFPYAMSAGSKMMAYIALILLPLILLGAGQPPLAIIAAVVAIVGIFLLRSRSKLPQVVLLGPSSASIPNWSARAEMMNVRYEEIQNVGTMKVGRTEMLVITWPKGESRLLASGFENENAFARFSSTLATRIALKRS